MSPPRTTRRGFLRTVTHLSLAGLGLATGSYGYVTHLEPGWLQVERVPLIVPDLPAALEGLRLAQLSDLHLHPFTTLEQIERAVERTNREQPDLVLLTGDYVTDRHLSAVDELLPVLARLNPRYGSWACLGNHDWWAGPRAIREGLMRAGINVLDNEGLAIDCGGELLYIAGLEDGWSGHPSLTLALEGHRGAWPVVLLVHEPDFADLFARDGRVTLQLSGHSHGGQVRLPGRGAPMLPWMGEKYDQGLYRVQDMWLYTNRGLGMAGIPIRFNCRPELTLLTLHSGPVG